MPSKTYTIRTEHGAMRLMTPEEVRDMVRRKMKRAKNYGSPKEQGDVRLPRSPTRIISTTALDDTGPELREPESETRDTRESSEHVREMEHITLQDNLLLKTPKQGKSLTSPSKTPSKSKLSEKQLSELIRQSIRRARLQVASIAPTPTSEVMPKAEEPKSRYDSDPQELVNDNSLSKAFSWSSLEESEDDEGVKQMEDQSESKVETNSQVILSPGLPVTASSESQTTVKTENLSEYFAPKDRVKLLRNRLMPLASQPGASKAENKGRKPDAPASKELEKQESKETESTSSRDKDPRRLELSQNVVHAMVSNSMARAEESARDEIKSILQNSTRHDSDVKDETTKETKIVDDSDIKALIRESIVRARQQAQEEIDLVVQETLRMARESAKEQIREMFVDSIQKAREPANGNDSVLMQQSFLGAATAPKHENEQPAKDAKESGPTRNRRLSAVLSRLGKTNLHDSILERITSPRKPAPELFRKAESFRSSHDIVDPRSFSKIENGGCTQGQHNSEAEQSSPKDVALPANLSLKHLSDNFGATSMLTTSSESKVLTSFNKNRVQCVQKNSTTFQLDTNQGECPVDEKGTSMLSLAAEHNLEHMSQPALHEDVAVQAALPQEKKPSCRGQMPESDRKDGSIDKPMEEEDEPAAAEPNKIGASADTGKSTETSKLHMSSGKGTDGGEVGCDELIKAEINVMDPQLVSPNGVVGRLKWKEAILAKIAALESQRVARSGYAGASRRPPTPYQLTLPIEVGGLDEQNASIEARPSIELHKNGSMETSQTVGGKVFSDAFEAVGNHTLVMEEKAEAVDCFDLSPDQSTPTQGNMICNENSPGLPKSDIEISKPGCSDETKNDAPESRSNIVDTENNQDMDRSSAGAREDPESNESTSVAIDQADKAAGDSLVEGKIGFELWKKSFAMSEKGLPRTKLPYSRNLQGSDRLAVIDKILKRGAAAHSGGHAAEDNFDHNVDKALENGRLSQERDVNEPGRHWNAKASVSGDVFDGLHDTDYHRNRAKVLRDSVHSIAQRSGRDFLSVKTKQMSTPHEEEGDNGFEDYVPHNSYLVKSTGEAKVRAARTPSKRVAAVPAIEIPSSDGNTDCASESQGLRNHRNAVSTNPWNEPLTPSSTVQARREKHMTASSPRGKKNMRRQSVSAVSTLSKSEDSRTKNGPTRRGRDLPAKKRLINDNDGQPTAQRRRGKGKKAISKRLDTGFCMGFMEMLSMADVGDDATEDDTVDDSEKSYSNSLESASETCSIIDSSGEKSYEDGTDLESSFDDVQSDQLATSTFSTDNSGTNASTVCNTDDEKEQRDAKEQSLFWWS